MWLALPQLFNCGRFKKACESCGEMAEWLNVPPWKGGILERVSRVRIPVSPPYIFKPFRFNYFQTINPSISAI
jgi:hypothetical protein